MLDACGFLQVQVNSIEMSEVKMKTERHPLRMESEAQGVDMIYRIGVSRSSCRGAGRRSSQERRFWPQRLRETIGHREEGLTGKPSQAQQVSQRLKVWPREVSCGPSPLPLLLWLCSVCVCRPPWTVWIRRGEALGHFPYSSLSKNLRVNLFPGSSCRTSRLHDF